MTDPGATPETAEEFERVAVHFLNEASRRTSNGPIYAGMAATCASLAVSLRLAKLTDEVRKRPSIEWSQS